VPNEEEVRRSSFSHPVHQIQVFGDAGAVKLRLGVMPTDQVAAVSDSLETALEVSGSEFEALCWRRRQLLVRSSQNRTAATKSFEETVDGVKQLTRGCAEEHDAA